MSVLTGGGYADGSFSVGTPSGGGTFIDGFPIGGPTPGAGGFEPTQPSIVEVSDTASNSPWSDVFKNLTIFGAQLYIQKKIGGSTGPGAAAPSPNNKGDGGSFVERIPTGQDRLTQPTGGMTQSNAGVIRIAAVGIGILVVVFMMQRS